MTGSCSSSTSSCAVPSLSVTPCGAVELSTVVRSATVGTWSAWSSLSRTSAGIGWPRARPWSPSRPAEERHMDTGVLFQPLQIGPVTIPNRIARAAHGTYFFRLGEPYVGASHIAYHQARAAHGVGLTVLDGVGVDPSGGNVVVLDGSVVERYQQLAAAVHPHGMKLF